MHLRWRGLMAAVCAGLMVATPWGAAAGGLTRSGQTTAEVAVSARPAGGAQVSARLAKEIATSRKPVGFLIKLREQANVESAAAAASARAATRARLAGRTAAVAALQETARRTQPAVEQLLRALQKKGHVREYRAYWIVNGFAVKGDKVALEALAARPEVERIDFDEPVFLLETPRPTAGGGLTGVEWGVDRIGAPAAWAMGVNGNGAVVGSIDTGKSIGYRT